MGIKDQNGDGLIVSNYFIDSLDCSLQVPLLWIFQARILGESSYPSPGGSS